MAVASSLYVGEAPIYTEEALSASGAPLGVTHNESWGGFPTPPNEWTGVDLHGALLLPLSASPATPAALALVETLTAALCEREVASRGNRRGSAGRAKLHQAVGAVVGGALSAWKASRPRAVFRSVDAGSFTGGLVGHRQFVAATDGLVALGLLHRKPGIRYQVEWGDGASQHGLCARYRPTAGLLDLAARHGVTAATVRADFRHAFSTVPPVVKAPLVLRGLDETRPARRGRVDRRDILIRQDDATARALAGGIATMNAFAARHDVQGCLPPRFRRVFTGDWSQGGRWYAVGDGGYQALTEAQRLAITINGAPIAEIDARASHLTIISGLAGLPLPDGDPYVIDGLGADRETVKRWIVATLGKGTPATRWPRGTPAGASPWNAKAVGVAVIGRYPFLAAPSRVLDVAPNALTHRLMNVEAAALTVAMTAMCERGILALPMHDGLIAPAMACAAASTALRDAYRAACGLVPMLKITDGAIAAPGGPRGGAATT